MITRLTIIIAYVIFIANIGYVFGFSSANAITKAVFSIASIMCILTRKSSPSIIILMSISLFMILFLGYFTEYPGFSWSTLFLSLNQVIIVYCFLAYNPSKKDCDSFMLTASLLPIASVLLGIVYDVLGVYSLWAVEWATGAKRFNGSLIPSFLSGLAMCGVFAALQFAVRGRPSFYIIAGINFIILILAGGRMPLAVTLLACGTSIAFGQGIPSKTKIFSIVGGLFSILIIFASTGSVMIERFSNSGDSGRHLLWDYTMGLANKYPYTGIGWGHQFPSVPTSIINQTASAAAHNDYIRLMAELGFVGMGLFYGLLTIAVLIASKKSGRFDFSVFAAYLGFLILSYTDNALATPSHFPIVILAYLTSCRFGGQVSQVRPRMHLMDRFSSKRDALPYSSLG